MIQTIFYPNEKYLFLKLVVVHKYLKYIETMISDNQIQDLMVKDYQYFYIYTL